MPDAGIDSIVYSQVIRKDDHYILHKLATELLPWMIAGRRVGSRGVRPLATGYVYVDKISTALAGLGVGAPLIEMARTEPNGSQQVDILAAIKSLPPEWAWPCGLGILSFIILRMFVQSENILSRGASARICAEGMKAQKLLLFQKLAQAEPMQDIIKIQQEVMECVNRAQSNGAWTYDPLPTDEKWFNQILIREVATIRTTFMSRWRPAPPESFL